MILSDFPIVTFEDIDLSHVEGVLIDLDDTLYLYDPCHLAALRACFAHHNFGLPFPAYQERYRAARSTVTRLLEPQGACRSRLFAFMALAEAEADKLPRGYKLAYDLDEIYWSTFIDTMKPDPDAFIFLKRCLEKQIPVCVVTDMTALVQIRKILQLEISSYVNALVTSEEVGAEKPDTRMFTVAAGKLGVPLKKCLMLGDSVEKDVKGAILSVCKGYLIRLNDNTL